MKKTLGYLSYPQHALNALILGFCLSLLGNESTVAAPSTTMGIVKMGNTIGSLYSNLRQEGTTPIIKITLTEDGNKTGETVIGFDPLATDSLVSDPYDATLLGDNNVYTLLSDGTKLSQNTLKWPRNEVNVYLIVNPNVASGTKYFTITSMTATGFDYFLYDDYLGDTIPITQGARKDFEFTSSSATRRPDRFKIITKPLNTGFFDVNVRSTENNANTLVLSPNPTQSGKIELMLQGAKAGAAEVEIVDIRGNVLYSAKGILSQKTAQGAGAQIDFGDLPSGIYLVRCTQAGVQYTQRLVVR